MDTLMAFVLNSPEAREFGYNLPTAMNVIINLLTLGQAWAAWKQSRTICIKQSADGVSVTTMCYFLCYFMAFFVYGAHEHALNMVFNAAQFPVYIYLVVSMWRYGSKETRQAVQTRLMQFIWFPIVMALIPWKDFFFLLLLGGILFANLMMGRELKRTSIESFEIKLPVVFFVCTIFWFFYAWSIHNWVLIAFNLLSALLLISTIMIFIQKKRATTR